MSQNMNESPKKATFGTSAEELFNNLTLDDPREQHRRGPSNTSTGGPARSPFADEPSGPPHRNGTFPTKGPMHRPSRSREEEERRMRERGGAPRGPPRSRGPPGPRPSNGGHSPDRSQQRRLRRNSESSMIDHGSLDPDEERRRRERRRMRDERSKDPKSRSSRTRRPQGLDIIDKLDVTGIYGPSMIHHDGPYDAVQPHRNRKKDHRAPMEAFPVGSANNALGGSGPVNKNIDLDTFHGRTANAYADFGQQAASEHRRPEMEQRSVSFNPKERDDIVHGETSMGLGTSTFLDGAPASRAAVQRRESETPADGGLGRKKSIAQRIRGISQPRRNFGDGNSRIMSPEARYGNARSPGSPQVKSAGGLSKADELNPFFSDDYGAAYDNKGAAIKETENKDPTSSPGGPSRNPLTRAMTQDSFEQTNPADSKPAGTGFLSRVKSLKGGRRPRPERPAPPA